MYKRWTVCKPDEQTVNELVSELGLSPAVARVAVSRGIETTEDLSDFLCDDSFYIDPFSLTDIDRAVERIDAAIECGEKILIFGDYDCDGVTSTAMLYTHLAGLGADVSYALPNRHTEGYGLSISQIDIAAKKGVSLIVTVDNGINCCQEVEYAKSLGIDVVITDHHIPGEEIPKAEAVVNPHLYEEDAEFRILCGVGVAFMLVAALSNAEPYETLWRYADLVATGTVADVMPIVGLNRFIVKTGLDVMNSTPRLGVRALLDIAGQGDKTVSAGNISFMLAPRINAAGRIDTADIALKLLISDVPEEASVLASRLNEMNVHRQQLEQKIVTEATEKIEKSNMKYDKVIVVSGDGWHQGVVGIAAARLVEKYARPVMVLAEKGGTAVGSGRSISGYSLYEALNEASDLLICFGGHELAAGMTVDVNNISSFRNRINSSAKTENMPFLSVRSDCEILPSELNLETVYGLSEFEPFGFGNPIPVFLLRNVKLERITPLSGGTHQKLTLSKDGVTFQALLFGVKGFELSLTEGKLADIAVTLSANEYKGNESLSVQIKAIRGAGAGGNECERDIRRYESFKRDDISPSDAAFITPVREDFAAVYRFICGSPICTRDSVKYALGKAVGFGKTDICIDVLCDSGVVVTENREGTELLQKNIINGKAELESSPIMIKLKSLQGQV